MNQAAPAEATKNLTRGLPSSGISGRAALKASLTAAALAAGGAVFFYAFWLVSRFEPLPPSGSAPTARLSREIASAEEKLKTDPENIELLTRAGELHFRAGPADYATAINELEEARDLGSLNPSIFYELGVMYQSEGLYPFALKEYDRYLRHFPHAADVAMRKAKLLFEAGRYEEASDEYADLLRDRPTDAMLKENLALSLWRAKKTDEAKQILSQLQDESRGHPEFARAEYFLGQMALEAKDYSGAEAAFENCRAAGGVPGPGVGPADLSRGLAKAYQGLKKYRDAVEQWKLVLASEPKDREAALAIRRYGRYLSRPERRQGRKKIHG
jgi:tetratricopeptide (TPR) repeat protein